MGTGKASKLCHTKEVGASVYRECAESPGTHSSVRCPGGPGNQRVPRIGRREPCGTRRPVARPGF